MVENYIPGRVVVHSVLSSANGIVAVRRMEERRGGERERSGEEQMLMLASRAVARRRRRYSIRRRYSLSESSRSAPPIRPLPSNPSALNYIGRKLVSQQADQVSNGVPQRPSEHLLRERVSVRPFPVERHSRNAERLARISGENVELILSVTH